MHYLVKIRHSVQKEDGSLKPQNETYLIDVASFSDAELIATQENQGKKGLQIKSITPYKVSDIFRNECTEDDGYIWFRAKVSYITFDEKSQKEKRANHFMLVLSDSVANANLLLKSKLGTLNDYEILDLVTTKIQGII
jgi:hypothetical protein